LIALLVFTLKWAVAGLAFAAVLLWMRPELRNASAPTQPPAPLPQPTSFSPALPAPAAASTIVPATTIPVAASYADAVARSAPAVVNIYTTRVVTERVRPQMPPEFERLFGSQSPAVRQRVEGSLGSGVIVDAHGHVVTNHHVIANATEISLQMADGRITSATLVGDDPDSDLALLQIKLAQSPATSVSIAALPVMSMGRSDQLRVGDVVLAIGNPYGLSQTVTHGIVSATGRDQLGPTPFENYIQTDAAINAGNSGGALINAQGELIGINTAVLAQGGSEGIGFAIPVNMVRGVVEQILKYGRVRRGWLGVTPQTVSPQRAAALGLPTTQGAQLKEIDANSPAQLAGLRPGDVITALNGQTVHDIPEAMNRVAGLKPGSRLRIQGRGDRGAFDVRVKIGERPKNEPASE